MEHMTQVSVIQREGDSCSLYMASYSLKLYRVANFYFFLSCMTGDYKFMQGTSVFKEF